MGEHTSALLLACSLTRHARATGDIIPFHLGDTVYDVAVVEVKPVNKFNTVSILNTDCAVDFAPPLNMGTSGKRQACTILSPAKIEEG